MSRRYLLSLSIILLVLSRLIYGSEPLTVAKPRVSIITSVFNGDEFIEGFLEDITRAKNFDHYELILINANSPGNEEPVIKKYLEKFSNIVYERLEKDPGIYGVWNYAIKKARSDIITNSNLDDRRNPVSLEEHVQYLEDNPHIDLVYSSYLITDEPNETFEENDYKFVVEPEEFSPSKMYLCLPGPQPTWRKSMHEKYGFFREDMKHAGDLEFWNRAVLKGSVFARLPGYSTLFYFNPQGLSTSEEKSVQLRHGLEKMYIRGAYGAHWNNAESPSLLIKIPTRSRPQQFFKQLDSYYRNLSGSVPYHFLITCDEDDNAMNTVEVKERLSWYPNLSYRFGKSTSKVEAYNSNLEEFNDYDIILAIADDMEPVMHGYDRIIVDTMLDRFPDLDGVLNFHDGFVGSAVNTYPVIGKQFYQRFGHIYHPFYKSLFANEELALVSRILGKEAVVETVLIRHNHPVWGLGVWDSLYARNEGLKEYDRQVFTIRRSHNFDLDQASLFNKDWSILICTLDERENVFQSLYDNLKQQIIAAGLEDRVELLFFKDNGMESIGYKRNELIAQSSGKYISFIDDDDLVHPQYVKMIYEKLLKDPDCVSLVGVMTTRGKDPKIFMHSIDFKEKTVDAKGIFKSPPNHLNPMRRVIAAQFLFPERSFGEDADWATRIAQSGLLKKEEKLEEPYYFYRYDGKYHALASNTGDNVLQYYCTAADDNYFNYVLHLIASIHTTNFEQLGEIAVANIGLKPEQVAQLNAMYKVRVFEVEKANPDIITPFVVNKGGKVVPGWYSWKPVAVKQALDWYPYVLWVDASSIVLRPLDALFKHIEQNGYFLSTIGNEVVDGAFRHPMSWCTTKRVRQEFGLDQPKYKWIDDAEQVMSTIFGVSRKSASLFDKFFTLSKDISLFADDGTTPTGLGSGRHDQTLLSVFVYINNLIVHKQDYTQQRPIALIADAQEEPLYITWHKSYVDHRTSIYSARADATSYSHFLKNIRYKNNNGLRHGADILH